jgi:DNA polymerase III epsilon subunit family exonuclease
MTNEFCETLYQKLNPEERILKFKSAEVVGSKITVSFLVQSTDYDNILDERLQNKIKQLAVDILPKELSVSVRFVKSSPDEKNVVNRIIEYMYNEHKTMYPVFANAEYKVEYENDLGTVAITLEKYAYDYAAGIGLSKKIEDYLDTQVMETFEVSFIEIPNTASVAVSVIDDIVNDVRVIDAVPKDKYTAGEVSNPRYIIDVQEAAQERESICLCGTVSDVKTRLIIKPEARIKEKELFIFLISDTTGRMKCKFFAKREKDFSWEDVFKDGSNLIMKGRYKFDTFDNRMCFYPSVVASAAINFDGINVKSNFNRDRGRYFYVFPEPYKDVAQDYLFDDTRNLPGDALDGKTFCVFDLETTGLNLEGDEIIEIGAIKIVDGQFTEMFHTFVKPTAKIPPKITEKTSITDEMVADAPSSAEVIPDFFRFVSKSILAGHNIANFDIPLLNFQSAKVKYEFTNEYIDTLNLARQKLRMNKNKLSDVCAALSVPLIDAHRAINDVAATAKIFIKLMKM